MYMRAFAEAWDEEAIVQQAVGQLPWGHNIVLLTKLKDAGLRLAYAEAAVESEAVAEYALRDNTQPLGIAQYQLAEALPDALRTALPSIEQIERELGDAAG